MTFLSDLSALLRQKRVLAWAVVHEVLALILCLHPGLRRLFGTPGFELAFATGILAAFSSGHVGLLAVARVRADGASGAGAKWIVRAFASSMGVLVVILGAPLATAAIAGVWNGRCDYTTGLVFFMLLPVASSAWGASVGIALGAFVHRRFAGYALYLGVCLASAAFSVGWLMTQAPIFVYDPFFGYFPGALYDELLPVGAPLLWFRAETLLATLAVLALCAAFVDPARGKWSGRPTSTRVALTGGLACLLAVSLRFFGGELGYFVSTTDVTRALGARHETPHFVIHYSRAAASARHIALVGLEHEFRYDQIRRYLGVEPRGKVHSFLYSDPAQKAKLMGARYVSIAKPWLLQLHLHDQGIAHPVLRHELTHVFGAAAGGLFGVSARSLTSFNVGLIEGLAVASDFALGPLTAHEWTRAAYDLLGDKAPSIEKILGVAGFWSESSSLAYTIAGSFVRYLIDTHGPARFLDAYRDGDFERAYGRGIGELARAWRTSLEGIKLGAAARLAAQRRFRRPSVFRRACAHEVSRLRHAALEARMRRQRTDEIVLLERACALEPDSVGHTEALVDALRRAGRTTDAHRIVDAALAAREGVKDADAARARLTRLRADLAWLADRIVTARTLYGQLLVDEGSPDIARRLAVSIAAIDHPIASPIVRDLLIGFSTDRVARERLLRDLVARAPELKVGHYLLGRHLYFSGELAEAARFLAVAARASLPGLELTVESKRLYGLVSVWLGDYAGAERAFRDVETSRHSTGASLEGRDGIERARFFRSQRTEMVGPNKK
jgi:hypothetical protein